MAEIDPILAGRDAALEAHRRFLIYLTGTIEGQQVALGRQAEEASDVAKHAAAAEVLFTEYLVDSVQTITIAMYRLIDEVKTDRFCVCAALAALAQQKFCDYEAFQRDFIEAAETLHGGPENVPLHARDVSMIILGQGPHREP